MFGNLQGWHFIVLLVIILLLFGAPKLPGLARSIGQSMRIFRSEVKTMKDDDKPQDGSAPAATPGATSANSTAPTTATADSISETKPNS